MSKNANGNGSIRKKTVTRDGKQYEYWEARYSAGVDPVTGKPRQKSITGKSQKEVTAKLKQVLAAMDNGSFVEPCKMTVREWSQQWLDEYASNEVKETSLYLYRTRVRLHVLPQLGNYELRELTAPILQKWVNGLVSEGLSPKTADHCRVVLHAMLKQAYLLDMLPNNVCDKVKPPRAEHREFQPLSDEDLKNLFAELQSEPEFAPPIRLALLTGLREAEIAGLSWEAIDFDHGTLTVKQQISRLEGAAPVCRITTPKSNKSRTITLAPMALDLLRAQLKRQQKNAVMLGASYSNPWNLVFTREDGSFYEPQLFGYHFKQIARKIGRPDLRFHDLRHTYATLCLQNGDSVKTVQNALGHSTSAITLDMYAHVTDRMAQESANKLQAYLENIG